MTEFQWLQGNNPQGMLHFVREVSSSRKLRLFLCALLRTPEVWSQLTSQASRKAVEVSKLFADQRADHGALMGVRSGAYGPYSRWLLKDSSSPWDAGCLAYQATMSNRVLREDVFLRLEQMVKNQEIVVPSTLPHEVFGNLFSTEKPDPAWLGWNDGAILGMAQTIYDEEAFDSLPVLADALEDAGCDSEAMLSHCREDADHVRGCWVLDQILGME